jgi:hypothetical protein
MIGRANIFGRRQAYCDKAADYVSLHPSYQLQRIRTLVEASADLKDDTQRKVLLRSVVVVAQKGLGVAPDRVAECEPNVLTFPTRQAAGHHLRALVGLTTKNGSSSGRPTVPRRPASPASDLVASLASRRRGSQGRVFDTGNEGMHRAHLGPPFPKALNQHLRV